MTTSAVSSFRGNGMPWYQNAELWAGAALILGTIGGGFRYILSHLNRKALQERAWVDAERQKLELAFNSRIDTLERMVQAQSRSITFLQTELHRYARHVGILEGLLRAHKIDAPRMEPPVTAGE